MQQNVFVFSTMKCPYAVMMKKWFKDKKIQITEITLDDSSLAELLKKYDLEEIKSPHLIINDNSIGSYMDLIKQESFVFHLLGLNNYEN